MPSVHLNRYVAGRSVVLAIAKLLLLVFAQIPYTTAFPFPAATLLKTREENGQDPSDPSLWLYLGVAAALVISGGAFAGLTIALMGQV
jgi:metal transporter CNNM